MSTHEHQKDVDQEILQGVLDDDNGKYTDNFVKTQRRICRKARGAKTGFVTTRYGKIAKVEYESDRKKPK